MSNPTTTAAVRRAGQILKSRDGLVATAWEMARAGRHEDALTSTHDLALLASDVLHLIDGIHTRTAEKHRRAALELLDEASAIRASVTLAQAEQAAREQAANVTPEPEATPEALERVHVTSDGRVLTLLQPEGLYRATTERVDQLRDEYAGVTTETMRSEWHLALRHVYGPEMPSHIARASRLEMLVCYGHGSVPEPEPAPEDPSAVPVAPEASEGAGRPTPVDHVLQARVGAEWQDCITGPDEAMVRELLARFDATYPGREHRIVSRPRTTEYLVELVADQDEIEKAVREWIEGAHRHYVGDGSMEPYQRQVGPLEVTLTADLDAEEWQVEVLSERIRADRLVKTLGEAQTWLYDLLVDDLGDRDEATYEVQGLYSGRWETETHASTSAEADSLLADYRRCAPGRPYRVLVRYPLPDGPWI